MNNKTVSRRDLFRWGTMAGSALLAAACSAPVSAPRPAATSAGNAAEVVPTEAGAAAATPVKLQFWSEVFGEWVQKQIDGYKTVKPEVEFEFVSFKWGEMTNKLLTATAGGTPPNSVIQDRFRVAGWASRGGTLELDNYVAEYKVSPEDYFPATWSEAVWNNHVHAIPFDTDGRFLFWNKTLFKEAGLDPEQVPPTEDWAAMTELAKKLTKTSSDGAVDVIGFVPQNSGGLNNGGDYVYAWANEGQFMKDERTAWMDNPKLVESLQWVSDTVNALGGIDKVSAFSAGLPATAGYSAFGSGKQAMAVTGDSLLSDIAKYYPDLNFGMAPWSIRNDPSKKTGFAGGFCLAVPAGAKEIESSYQWLNHIASYDAQVSLGAEVQRIPALKKAALSDDLIKKSPYPELRKLANESMQYANFRPVTPVAERINELWSVSGRDEALYGRKTAEQACKDMQVQVQKDLDEYWSTVAPK